MMAVTVVAAVTVAVAIDGTTTLLTDAGQPPAAIPLQRDALQGLIVVKLGADPLQSQIAAHNGSVELATVEAHTSCGTGRHQLSRRILFDVMALSLPVK